MLKLIVTAALGHGAMVQPRSRNAIDWISNVNTQRCSNVTGDACNNGTSEQRRTLNVLHYIEQAKSPAPVVCNIVHAVPAAAAAAIISFFWPLSFRMYNMRTLLVFSLRPSCLLVQSRMLYRYVCSRIHPGSCPSRLLLCLSHRCCGG